ncbi:MAG: CRISPR-associated endoribonuclease Cas6 [Haloferacaceae archaeon]
MRLLIRLRARADGVYDHAYHHKLRGRLWRALDGTEFDAEHGTGDPTGLVFSNVFPWGDFEEGDERTVLVASPREPLLAAIAEGVRADREFNVGEMPFEVTDLDVVDPDVGEPGTRGTIETGTGVVVRLYGHHREEYGIDAPDAAADVPTYWRPDHAMAPFVDAVEDNLQRKHERFAPEYVPGPAEVDDPLFDGYELLKTYSLPVTVTAGEERTMVLSKWSFDYIVRDDTHRRHLNLALATGIGGRNGLGFGFVNVVERTRPGETDLGGENAFA